MLRHKDYLLTQRRVHSFIHSFITIYKAHCMSAMPNQRRWRQSLGGQLSAK